jgi:hypothetical protein
MSRLRPLALFCVLAGSSLAFGGCSNKARSAEQPSQAQPPSQEAQLAAEAINRIHEIEYRVKAFEAASNLLPGETEAQNRRMMQESFSSLTQILPLIEGPSPSSEFRQGMRVLDTSRQQLASGSTNLATEPTIGQGLRATSRLLANINNLVFGSDPAIGKRIDAVQQRVDQLDTAHGGMNRVVAAQAMRETAGVLRQMSSALADRAGLEGPKPTTNPATASASAAAIVR